jgi:imidazolonepropionase-like amidohydrolase
VRIGEEYHLDYVIVHCTEGHLIADTLARHHVRAITGPILTDRSKPELRNQHPKNSGVLERAGILPAICTDHPVIPIQYLPLSAAICVKHGMSYENALKGITIRAAELAGIDDRVGSLKVGKDADILVFERDPLDVQASPKYVFINGKMVKGN